nr:unnamed protein product [Callosobruchus chinensis]
MKGDDKTTQHDLEREKYDVSDSNQNGQSVSENDNKEGKYNALLILLLIFPTTSQVFETAGLSYVLPIAQCDLDITLEDIGLIIGMTYVGMIATGFFWGCLSDAYGRKNILICGLLLNGAFMAMAAFSTNSTLLMISKVFAGVGLGGHFSTAIVHSSEFYRKEYRGTAKLLWGIMESIANMILPLLAWLVLTNRWEFTLGDHEYHTWNAFLLICAMFPIAGGICYIFIPESPKYLMSSGNNTKAIKVFQEVYTMNTGKQKSTYPHQNLEEERNFGDDKPAKRSATELILNGLKELRFLLRKPYTTRIILVCSVSFSLSTSFNTMRIWLPQMFKAINDYQLGHNGTSTDICVMLQSWHEQNQNHQQVCDVDTDNSPVYIQSTIVALTRLVAYLIAAGVIKYVGSKKLVLCTAIATFLLTGGIYFAQSSRSILIISSLSNAMGNVSTLMFVSISVEMFPTTLRTIAITLHHTSSRVATLMGNLLFPYLLETGCVPTFTFVALGPLESSHCESKV